MVTNAFRNATIDRVNKEQQMLLGVGSMRYPLAGALALALCIPATPVLAHHSMAMFDQS